MTSQPSDPRDEQRQRLFNQYIVNTQVCAQCYGALVERYLPAGSYGLEEDAYAVSCPRRCQPGGFVDRAWADEQRAKSAAEYDEVKLNYPMLAPPGSVLTRDDQERIKRQLFGE